MTLNPSHGSIADFTESFLQKVFHTSSLDRQMAAGLSQISGKVGLIGYSQGSLTASNALVNLGVRGDQLASGSTAAFRATVLSYPRALASSWMGGASMAGNTSRFFDVINLVNLNPNPAKIAGGAVGAGLGFGVKEHGASLIYGE